MAKIFCLALAWLFFSHFNQIEAQWAPANGPYGKIDAYWYIEMDEIALTGTQNGFYSRKDADSIWNFVSTFSSTNIFPLGDTLFMLDEQNGLAYIIPADSLFTPETIPLGTNEVTGFASDNQNQCYAASLKSGFFFSLDHGITWQTANEGLPTDTLWNPWIGYYYFRDLFGLAANNETIFTITNNGLYRCQKNELIWEKDSAASSLNPKTILSFKEQFLLLTGTNLFSSANDGSAWIQHPLPNATTNLFVVDSLIFAATSNGEIFVSADTASSWTFLGNHNESTVINNIATVHNNKLMVSCMGYGNLMVNENTWRPQNLFISSTALNSMVTTTDYLVAIDRDSMYRSTNGIDWKNITPQITKSYFGSLTAKGDTLILSYKLYSSNPYFHRDQFLMYSPDNGSSWLDFHSLPQYWGDDPYQIALTDNGFMAYEDDQAYLTNDWGISWLSAPIPSQYCNNFNSIYNYNGQIFASACGSAQVLKLNGTDWMYSGNTLPTDREITKLFGFHNFLYAMVQVHGLYKSTDNGTTWQPTTSSPPLDWGITGVIAQEKYLAMTSHNGIWISGDEGDTWLDVNDNLKNRYLFNPIFRSDSLFVSTVGNGIFYRPISSLPSAIESPFFINRKNISIRPNPANKLIYLNTNQTELHLNYQIFDYSGQCVTQGTAIQGEPIDVAHLIPGFYFLKIKETQLAAQFLISR